MQRFLTAGIQLVFFTGLMLVTSVAQETGTIADREQILKIERIFADTAVSNDVRELDDILADDYLGTEPDGKLVTKAEYIAEAKSQASEYASCRLMEDTVKIRHYSNVAVVNGTENWTRKDGKSGRFIWTDVMVNSKGKWKVVSSQDLAVSTEK